LLLLLPLTWRAQVLLESCQQHLSAQQLLGLLWLALLPSLLLLPSRCCLNSAAGVNW
jgi:hypothetical protein